MEFNLDSIKSFFKDENGKPKQKNIIIFTFIIAALILVLKISIKPTSLEDEENPVNVDYNLPEPEEKSTVRIGKNSDIGYVTKGELEYTLSKQLEQFAQLQAETLSIVLESSQQSMVQTIQDETKNQQRYIESNLEKRFMELEKEIETVKQNSKDHEYVLKNLSSGSDYNTSSKPSSTSTSPNSSNSNSYEIPSGVPTNDYTGFSGYPTENNSYNTEITRNDSGFIVNNYKPVETNYIMNSGEIYKKGYLLTNGVTAGQLFNGVLITGAVSSKSKCPVIVKLIEDIMVKDKIVIPRESRLTGYAIADFNTRQIYFDVDRLILQNREVSIKASLVNQDGTPGFCSKYIDKSNQQFWKTFALDFLSSLIQSYKDITYFVSDKGIPVKSYDDTSLNKAIDASSEGLTNFANRIMADAQAMGAIILVDPNIEVKIMIEENIPLENIR